MTASFRRLGRRNFSFLLYSIKSSPISTFFSSYSNSLQIHTQFTSNSYPITSSAEYKLKLSNSRNPLLNNDEDEELLLMKNSTISVIFGACLMIWYFVIYVCFCRYQITFSYTRNVINYCLWVLCYSSVFFNSLF